MFSSSHPNITIGIQYHITAGYHQMRRTVQEAWRGVAWLHLNLILHGIILSASHRCVINIVYIAPYPTGSILHTLPSSLLPANATNVAAIASYTV
jgi:hypothetical protein